MASLPQPRHDPFLFQLAASVLLEHRSYDLAAQLFQEAAKRALTEDGRRVLLDQARTARQLAAHERGMTV